MTPKVANNADGTHTVTLTGHNGSAGTTNFQGPVIGSGGLNVQAGTERLAFTPGDSTRVVDGRDPGRRESAVVYRTRSTDRAADQPRVANAVRAAP